MSVQLSRVITAASRAMGDTLSLRSVELASERSSPVMALDDFRVTGRPFAPHPHAGFSAVTYVFRDSPCSLRNRDSLGGHTVVGPGGICWLQAGSGAMHEEIPATSGGELHGLQVFVNLSARNKLSAPRTLSLPAEQVPVWRSPTGDDLVRVVVGSYDGVASSLEPIEPFTLLDVELHRELSFALASQHNAVLYVRRGGVVIRTESGEQSVFEGQAVIAFGGAGIVRASATSRSELLLLSGAEIRERVVTRGPFVMNEPAEIDAAIERFRAGRMGHLEPYAEG